MHQTALYVTSNICVIHQSSLYRMSARYLNVWCLIHVCLAHVCVHVCVHVVKDVLYLVHGVWYTRIWCVVHLYTSVSIWCAGSVKFTDMEFSFDSYTAEEIKEWRQLAMAAHLNAYTQKPRADLTGTVRAMSTVLWIVHHCIIHPRHHRTIHPRHCIIHPRHCIVHCPHYHSPSTLYPKPCNCIMEVSHPPLRCMVHPSHGCIIHLAGLYHTPYRSYT